MQNHPSPRNFPRWFDPRNRHLGYWAYILNRVTAIGLVVYLFLHLVVLGTLARGPEAYNAFIAFAKQPVVVFGELLVVAAGIIHGLNGIRVGMTSFGVSVTRQRVMFIVLMVVAAAAIVGFAVHMFAGA
jgi:succinate dehydrogenase / fumarate reductase, cytochrome b subunit